MTFNVNIHLQNQRYASLSRILEGVSACALRTWSHSGAPLRMPCRGSVDISGLLWEVPVAPKVQRVSCLLVYSLLFMVLLASFIQHLQVWSRGCHPEQGGVSASVKEFKFESETGDYVKMICVPTLTCVFELWVVTKKKVTDKIWCERCLGPALERRLIGELLLLHNERNQVRCFGIQPGASGTSSLQRWCLRWFGDVSVSHQRSWRRWGRTLFLTWLPLDQISGRGWMDGCMDNICFCSVTKRLW